MFSISLIVNKFHENNHGNGVSQQVLSVFLMHDTQYIIPLCLRALLLSKN